MVFAVVLDVALAAFLIYLLVRASALHHGLRAPHVAGLRGIVEEITAATVAALMVLTVIVNVIVIF